MFCDPLFRKVFSTPSAYPEQSLAASVLLLQYLMFLDCYQNSLVTRRLDPQHHLKRVTSVSQKKKSIVNAYHTRKIIKKRKLISLHYCYYLQPFTWEHSFIGGHRETHRVQENIVQKIFHNAHTTTTETKRLSTTTTKGFAPRYYTSRQTLCTSTASILIILTDYYPHFGLCTSLYNRALSQRQYTITHRQCAKYKYASNPPSI